VKRVTNTQKVFNYLEMKKLACSKNSISKATKLSLKQVNNALAGLRRRKRVGVERVYWGKFGDVKQKSYWGVR